jgi:hypothetical protein
VQTARPQGREAWAESFQPVLQELRERVQVRRPDQIAQASGATWQAEDATFRLDWLDTAYRITWPTLIAYPAGGEQPCAADVQGLFLYYLDRADGAPLANRWIAFRELRDGWLYHQAFQGYTGNLLVQKLQNDIGTFARAAERIGGRPEPIGDAGYAFTALPRVMLAVVYWLGDEEFAPTCQVLFDAAASHYLPIDGLAMLGSRLIRRLLA